MQTARLLSRWQDTSSKSLRRHSRHLSGGWFDEYGPRLEDFDLFEGGLASVGLACLVDEACQAGVVRAPAGLLPGDIQLTSLAGVGDYVLVMLALGRSGVSISRWPTEVAGRSAFAGPEAIEAMRECLENVLDEANCMLPALNALAPCVAEEEVDEL